MQALQLVKNKEVSLETFLGFVKKREMELGIKFQGGVRYSSLIELYPIQLNEGHDSSIHSQQFAPLIPGDMLAVFYAVLFSQSKHVVLTTDLNSSIDFMGKSHAYEFGNTKYIIDLGRGRYMPANPDDFLVYSDGKECAICLLAKNRTVVYTVMEDK